MRHLLILLLLFATPGLAQQRSPQAMEQLLSALKAAPDEQASGMLEAHIRAQWAELASPAIRLLLSRATRNIQANAAAEALDDFDAALDLDATLAEAWRGRAQARYRMGDTDGSLRDLQEAVRREPRSFAAFQDLSRMAEGRQDWKGALSAWQRVLEIAPKTPGGQTRLRDLQRRALGEAT